MGGDSMKTKMKSKFQFTLSKFITYTTALPIVFMGVIIISVALFQFRETVSTIESRHINREVETMHNQIEMFLDVRKTALNDVALQPIMVQTVLHPANNIENIQDYMNSLRILNKNYTTSLFDFTGNVLYTEDDSKLLNKTDFLWMEKLLTGEVDSYIGTINDETYFWVIAVPVVYNASIEGVLVAEIPIAEMFIESELSDIPDNMRFDIYSKGELAYSLGKDVKGIKFNETFENSDLTLEFTLDNSESIDAITKLSYYLAGIAGLFVISTILVLVNLGNQFVTIPINKIRFMAQQLARGNNASIEASGPLLVEMQALVGQFIDMSNKIEDRENRLRKTNMELEESHLELSVAIDKLEKTQGQMIQQEKLASIGQLAAGVAHELNNPIGFVSSNFSVLKDYFEELKLKVIALYSEQSEVPDEDIKFILEDIPELISDSQEGLVRVTSIVKNLRDFSRIDSLDRSDYSLNAGVKSTLIIAKNEYKYVAVIDKSLAELPDIRVKGSDINDVIMNLVVNASHAIASLNMAELGLIQVRTYTEDDYVCLDVIDDGPGIHESVIGRIFDPFFTTKEPGKGTGLGLNIAYNTIVNKHQGVLLVESEYGSGAKFTMKLPLK